MPISRFASGQELRDFFAACDEQEAEGVEPDWQEHLRVIGSSRGTGASAFDQALAAAFG